MKDFILIKTGSVMVEFDDRFMKEFAKKIVEVMKIGKKPNKIGIKRAKNRFKWVNRLLEKDRVNSRGIALLSGLKGKRLDKAIEELQKPIYGPLLWKIGNNYKIKKKVGETVLIVMHPEYEELSKMIADEVRKRGAHAKISNRTAKDLVRSYKHVTAEACAEAPEPFSTYSTGTDVLISCYLDSDNWKKKVNFKKIKAGAPVSILLRRMTKKYGQRGVGMGLPFKQLAQECGVPYPRFRRVFYESLKESFSPRIKKLVDFYVKELSNKKVRIIADDGTDLTVKCRRMKRDIGTFDPDDPADDWFNLPTGEAFTAIVEDQTNGEIFFKKISPRGYGTIDNIWLEFKDGKLVNYKTSPNGMKIFKKMLDENIGGKFIAGELGIGCNRKAQFLNGPIIVDEKIFGTIHVALGENIIYGGKNSSSLHFDMVKDMKCCNGQMWVGKKLVMDKGMPMGLKI